MKVNFGEKKTKMKCIEPIPGLILYFDDTDKGRFYTSNASCISRSSKDKMLKETKMTRQETINKLKSVKTKQDHDGERIKASVLVDGLEALGLIKFDQSVSLNIPNSFRKHLSIKQIEDISIVMVNEGWRIVKENTNDNR